MLFSKSTVMLLAHCAAVLADSFEVAVGKDNAITFSPNSLTVAKGDQVKFVFEGGEHTVTSGDPTVGCSPNGQFYSGVVAITAQQQRKRQILKAMGAKLGKRQNQDTAPSFTVTLNDTNPISVYCSVAKHCQGGMVMMINPSSSGDSSLQQYVQAASRAQVNVEPQGNAYGGVLANI